ncbi:TPA: hypothetical protein ACGADT_004062 [Salmonella enterica subsp. enterica serovar Newport]
MNRYIVRIELHDAKPEDYDVLHQIMAGAQFSRKARCEDGSVYHLPTAEYYTETMENSDELLHAIIGAASAATKLRGGSFEILLSKLDSLTTFHC